LDSRESTQPEPLHLGRDAVRLLTCLSEREAGMQALSASARAIGIEEIDATLRDLIEAKLVFEEQGRFISLVTANHGGLTSTKLDSIDSGVITLHSS
jgi:hypothetical protein